MIPRSTTFAAIAVLLSLAAHFLGVGFTWPVQPLPSVEETSSKSVDLGNAFEDVADSISEPVRPEPAAVPEPPVEAAPVPESADDPTSRALVASANPQAVSVPDTGTAQAARPEATGPSTPEPGGPSEPTTVAPAGAEERASLDPRLAPPTGTDVENSIPQGQPSRRGEAEAPPPNPAASLPAAMPTAAVPVPPVTATPVPPSVPVVSLEPSEY